MAGTIFINYRRGESLKDAQHLATLLANRFGEKRIFLDVRGIDGGEHWLHALEKQVAASEAMVALIGKGWIDVKDEEGNRRLDNPNDFVRFEIAQALQRDIPVLPVLLDGAQVPRIAQLPQDMMALSLFQAMPLRTESVVQDAEAIARRLKIVLDKRRRRGVPAWAAGIGAAFLLTASVAAGPFVLGQLGLMPVAPSLSDVQAQLDIAKGDLAKAREDAERLRPAVQERDQARSALGNANQKVAGLQKAIDAANSDMTKAREEADRLRPAVQERDQARSALANVNQRVADLQKVIDAANSDMAMAREEADRLRPAVQERDQARSLLANANQKVVDLQKMADAANSDLEKARTEATRLTLAVVAAQRERDQARADVASAIAKSSGLQKQLDTIRRETDERRNATADLTASDPVLSVAPGSGQSLRDGLVNGQPCPTCPELVVVPAGKFLIGSSDRDPDRDSMRPGSESPQREVTIARAFAVGKYSVTRSEFAAFANATGFISGQTCHVWDGKEWKSQLGRSWRSPGFEQDDRHPVVCVSWNEAKAYASWLRDKTGKPYRLLSETEREYVARAKTDTPFWWGASITTDQANYQPDLSPISLSGGSQFLDFNIYRKKTVPVDSFKPNPWGLYNVHGNVWEWTEDCWDDNHFGNPGDGTARTTGICTRRVVRGGAWNRTSVAARAASRGWNITGFRGGGQGFRIGRSLEP